MIVVVLVLSFAVGSFGQGTSSREYVQNLTVPNGGEWGEWAEPEFCPENEFAIGYSMKMDEYHIFGDDTMLNGISLLCTGGVLNTTITSGVGNRGEWQGRVSCHQNAEQLTYLRAFDLQVEENQGGSDDTAANFIKFKCGVADETLSHEELAKDPGHGHFGEYGPWSDRCSTGTAICGIQTKVEADQGEGDDTMLNDVIFFCCWVSEAFREAYGGEPVVGK